MPIRKRDPLIASSAQQPKYSRVNQSVAEISGKVHVGEFELSGEEISLEPPGRDTTFDLSSVSRFKKHQLKKHPMTSLQRISIE